MSRFETHAGRDLLPRHRQLADVPQSPVDLLLLAAALLTDPSLPRSSERQATADRLRRLVRQLSAVERTRQRRDPVGDFGGEGR